MSSNWYLAQNRIFDEIKIKSNDTFIISIVFQNNIFGNVNFYW